MRVLVEVTCRHRGTFGHVRFVYKTLNLRNLHIEIDSRYIQTDCQPTFARKSLLLSPNFQCIQGHLVRNNRPNTLSHAVCHLTFNHVDYFQLKWMYMSQLYPAYRHQKSTTTLYYTTINTIYYSTYIMLKHSLGNLCCSDLQRVVLSSPPEAQHREKRQGCKKQSIQIHPKKHSKQHATNF